MKYVCDVCGWEYDEEEGYPEGPAKMMNSLSSISRLKSLTAWKPFG